MAAHVINSVTGRVVTGLGEMCRIIINFPRKRGDLQINKRSDLEGKIKEVVN